MSDMLSDRRRFALAASSPVGVVASDVMGEAFRLGEAVVDVPTKSTWGFCAEPLGVLTRIPGKGLGDSCLEVPYDSRQGSMNSLPLRDRETDCEKGAI